MSLRPHGLRGLTRCAPRRVVVAALLLVVWILVALRWLHGTEAFAACQAVLCGLIFAWGRRLMGRGSVGLLLEFRLSEEGLVSLAALLGAATSFAIQACSRSGMELPEPYLQNSVALLAAASSLVLARLWSPEAHRATAQHEARLAATQAATRHDQISETVGGRSRSVASVVTASLAVAAPFSLWLWWSGEHGMTDWIAVCMAALVAPALQSLARVRRQSGDSAAIETLASVDTVLFEKAGVLTNNRPRVEQVIPIAAGTRTEDVLHLAAVAEYSLRHPYRAAILSCPDARLRTVPGIKDVEELPDRGVRARLNGQELLFGNQRLLEESDLDHSALDSVSALTREARHRGESVLYACLSGRLIGAVCMGDALRDETVDSFGRLREHGFSTGVLSGDAHETLTGLAGDLSPTHLFADLRPEDEARHVDDLCSAGHGVGILRSRAPEDGDEARHRIALECFPPSRFHADLFDAESVPFAVDLLLEARSARKRRHAMLSTLRIYQFLLAPLAAFVVLRTAPAGVAAVVLAFGAVMLHAVARERGFPGIPRTRRGGDPPEAVDHGKASGHDL